MNGYLASAAVLALISAALVVIASTVLVLSARRAAKAAVADTLRLDAIEQRRLSVFAGEGSTDWGVMDGTKLAASSANLRAAIDAALDEEGGNHG